PDERVPPNRLADAVDKKNAYIRFRCGLGVRRAAECIRGAAYVCLTCRATDFVRDNRIGGRNRGAALGARDGHAGSSKSLRTTRFCCCPRTSSIRNRKREISGAPALPANESGQRTASGGQVSAEASRYLPTSAETS